MWASLQLEMLCYAGLGAFALWMRLKYGPSFVRGVEQLVDEIIDDFRFRVLVHVAIFVVFGSVLSVIMVEPTTQKQALAAGMAWTALLGSLATVGTKRGKAGGNAPEK